MEQQIIRITDDAGLRLHRSAMAGLEFYAAHIDELFRWLTLIEQIENLAVSHGLSIGVDLNDLRILISIDSLLSRALADLHLISDELYLAKVKMQQVYYIKQAYLVIFETFENFRVQQPLLYRMIKAAGSTYEQDFASWNDQKKEFYKQFKLETEIRTVRDKLAGHIELDFKLWYQTILSLDPMYTSGMIIAYINLLHTLQQLASKMVNTYKELLNRHNQESKKNTYNLFAKLEKLVDARIDLSSMRDLLNNLNVGE